MFRYLGRFSVLAVCLFAIVIVMVGCNGGEKKIDPPIVTLPEKTPGEKLAGRYELVETVGDSGITRPPDVAGDLLLLDVLGTYNMSITIAGETRFANGSWGADDTHITFDGTRYRYSWDGTYLTFSNPDGSSLSLKWQKN